MYVNALGTLLSDSAKWTNSYITGIVGGDRWGTLRNDIFHGVAGEKLMGGTGDDTYYLWNANAVVVEKAGEGIDTIDVRYWGGVKLPDYVENVVLTSVGATWATGNALDNIIVAGVSGATMDGGKGNDVLVGGGGSDIFKVTAGNGSDVIANFRPGWDLVKLDGYGFKSFAELKAAMTQTGNDVQIQLSSGEQMVMRGLKIDDLNATDFGLPMDFKYRTGATHVLDTLTAWNANGWYVINNVWNPGSMVLNKDYTINSSFSVGDMSGGTVFNWSFPQKNDVFPDVIAYPQIAFGYSPLNPAPPKPSDLAVFPIKVADLVSLTADYSVSYGGHSGGFNVAYDIWLSKSATANGKSAVSNEVMVWVHTGAFPPFGELIGTYSHDGLTGKIYHTGTYTAVVLDKDVPIGKLDIHDLLNKLTDMGIVSKDEYLRSVELGAEVVSGAGSLTINNLDLNVVSKAADGSVVTRHVSGEGATQAPGAPVADTALALPGAGDQRLVDELGHVNGNRTVRIGADGKAVVSDYDLSGTLTGADIVERAGGKLITHHYSGTWTYLGSDNVSVTKDGDVLTQRFDAKGGLIDAQTTATDASGVVVTHLYDAKWAPIGGERVLNNVDGSKTVQHFDAKWTFTGAEKTFTTGNTVTTETYDAKMALTEIERVVTSSDGSVSVQHYNASWKLISADLTKYGADNTATTYHYNGDYKLLGLDVETLSSNGIGKTLNYDAGYKLLSTEYTGTDWGDTLSGSNGATAFHGGLGSDVLKGGAGADTFYFDTAIGRDVDKIIGFDAAKDKIALDHDIFATLNTKGSLDATMFATGTRAVDASDRIVYDKATGNLFYDDDGAGAHAAVLFANIGAGLTLTPEHFVIA